MTKKKLTKKEKDLYKKFSLFCEKIIEITQNKEYTREDIVEGLNEMKEFFSEKAKG